MKALAVGLVCAALLGCTAQPSPSLTSAAPYPTGSPLPAGQLAPAPPESVQQALATARLKFVPLTPVQLAEVRTPVNAAEQTALSDRGMGYGPDGARVVWKKVGCLFLGWYTGEQEPSIGYVPPTYPAYLVQVLAPAVPGFDLINIEVIVVNARTGERGPAYGGGPAPSGIMGTTCGVTP